MHPQTIATGVAQLLTSFAQVVARLDLNQIWESRSTGMLLGFLVGVLAVPIAERIKDQRLRKQVAVAIRGELEEIKARAAIVALMSWARFGGDVDLTNQAQAMKRLLLGYKGSALDLEGRAGFVSLLDNEEQFRMFVTIERSKRDEGQSDPQVRDARLGRCHGDPLSLASSTPTQAARYQSTRENVQRTLRGRE